MEEVHHPLGSRQPAEVAVYDDAVEAVVDEASKPPNSWVNRSMANLARPGRNRKSVKRGRGKPIVEGGGIRLADEVRYIQQRAPTMADASSRLVS